MRIFILTILFAVSFYFFKQDQSVEIPRIDSIKLKMGAPKRITNERLLTVDATPVPTPSTALEKPLVSPKDEDDSHDGLEEVEEVSWTEIENAWNAELKDFLMRLEPATGEKMHQKYLIENESYRAEIDSLMNEKQQKMDKASVREIERVMTELDEAHDIRLKKILGAHYEAVQDHYQRFIQTSNP